MLGIKSGKLGIFSSCSASLLNHRILLGNLEYTPNMLSKTVLLVFFLCMVLRLEAYSPVSKLSRPIGICIRNCAQCKKMYGPYFDGELCGDACIKFKGKIIPDCDDIASVAPFLNKLE